MEYYWLIDPLGGTKEFIKKNGEFTVNIALIVSPFLYDKENLVNSWFVVKDKDLAI